MHFHRNCLLGSFLPFWPSCVFLLLLIRKSSYWQSSYPVALFSGASLLLRASVQKLNNEKLASGEEESARTGNTAYSVYKLCTLPEMSACSHLQLKTLFYLDIRLYKARMVFVISFLICFALFTFLFAYRETCRRVSVVRDLRWTSDCDNI
jgi:hypothetical protein